MISDLKKEEILADPEKCRELAKELREEADKLDAHAADPSKSPFVVGGCGLGCGLGGTG